MATEGSGVADMSMLNGANWCRLNFKPRRNCSSLGAATLREGLKLRACHVDPQSGVSVLWWSWSSLPWLRESSDRHNKFRSSQSAQQRLSAQPLGWTVKNCMRIAIIQFIVSVIIRYAATTTTTTWACSLLYDVSARGGPWLEICSRLQDFACLFDTLTNLTLTFARPSRYTNIMCGWSKTKKNYDSKYFVYEVQFFFRLLHAT